MALHVLQLGPYPPPEGGVSRNMIAIRDELRARDDQCSIIATSRSSSIREEPEVYHPRSGLGVIRLLNKIRFDVLHLHIGGDVGWRNFLLAITVVFFGRGKSVLTIHSGEFPLTKEAVSATPGSIRGFIFRRFATIICVNEQLADVFRRYGVPPKRVSVILPFSLKMPDDDVLIPKELNEFFAAHSPVLFAVGGLEKDYDPLFQVRAMKSILDEFPDAGLMIVGDGSMRETVEKAVAESGYADNIYLAGNIEHPVTLHLINKADVLLRTTLFDGDAISVREALFMGTPVIATDNGMRPDGVHLIPVQATDELVKEVKALARLERKPKAVGADDTDNINAVLDLYDDLR